MATVAAAVGFHGDYHLGCRRNIMIDSFPEKEIKRKRIQPGDDVILEITDYCRSYNRLEENFGEGAISASDEKSGWTAQIIEEGLISVEDRFFVF